MAFWVAPDSFGRPRHESTLREIPSFFIREYRVERFNPKRAAAPLGPERTHLVLFSGPCGGLAISVRRFGARRCNDVLTRIGERFYNSVNVNVWHRELSSAQLTKVETTTLFPSGIGECCALLCSTPAGS
jgi:hypothetical protein